MKTQDLYIPIGQEVVIKDKMFFVPQRGAFPEFPCPQWSEETLFGNENPITIEYCSGNGSWILEKAKQNPEKNFIAIEMQFLRARKIWKKIHSYNLSNVVIAWAEGIHFTSLFIPDAKISEVFVNFPDPWPKRRHARLRIIQPNFVKQMERIIQKDGTITLVTDDELYSEIMMTELQKSDLFSNALTSNFIEPPVEYGTSFFEELFRSKGKQIRFHKYVRAWKFT